MIAFGGQCLCISSITKTAVERLHPKQWAVCAVTTSTLTVLTYDEDDVIVDRKKLEYRREEEPARPAIIEK